MVSHNWLNSHSYNHGTHFVIVGAFGSCLCCSDGDLCRICRRIGDCVLIFLLRIAGRRGLEWTCGSGSSLEEDWVSRDSVLVVLGFLDFGWGQIKMR